MRRRIRIAIITLLLLAVVGVGGYFTYARLLANQTGPDLTQFGIEADQEVQIISVRRGDLSNAVTVNGSLRYATRETFRIPFSGTVDQILVEAGERIIEGDVLLVMDDTALVDADKAFREAEVNLQDAQKALDDLLSPPETTVRAANLKIKNARNALANAEADLADSLDPDGTAQKAAQKAVQNAENAVNDAAKVIENAEQAITDAEDAVDDARQGISDAENGIVNANLSLRAADKAIKDHDGAITQADINLAQEALDRANQDLQLAQDSIAITRANADANVRKAQRAYDDAYEAYNDVWKRWLGVDLDGREVSAPATLFTLLNINLNSLYGDIAKSLSRDISSVDVDSPLPLDDPGTVYDEQLVAVWLRFNAGAVEINCGHLPETPNRLCIQKQFDDAWDALLPLKEALDTAKSDATRTKVDADRSVIDAQQAIDKAVEALNDLLPSEDRANARADLVTRRDLADVDVDKAERQLTKANENLEKARQNVVDAQDDLVDAQDKHAQAIADLEDARTELTKVQDPNNRENTDFKVAIESKQLDLDNALEELRVLENPTLAEIELKRAEIAAAQRSFDDAKIPDAQGEIVATFSGVVGSVDVVEGENVSKGQAAVVIADPNSVEMRGSVDEVDVLFLQVGDQADVSMDALGDEPVLGTITDIAAFGNTTSGVIFGADFEQDVGSVSYPVTVSVQAPAGASLPEGLSASAQVVIRDIQNVLLVPVGAIFGTLQDPQLLVQTSTNPATYELRPVVLGVSDDFWTEIISGVEEGQDILMTVVGGGPSFDDFGGF